MGEVVVGEEEAVVVGEGKFREVGVTVLVVMSVVTGTKEVVDMVVEETDHTLLVATVKGVVVVTKEEDIKVEEVDIKAEEVDIKVEVVDIREEGDIREEEDISKIMIKATAKEDIRTIMVVVGEEVAEVGGGVEVEGEEDEGSRCKGKPLILHMQTVRTLISLCTCLV